MQISSTNPSLDLIHTPILNPTQRPQRTLQLLLSHHDGPRPRRTQITHLDGLVRAPDRPTNKASRNPTHNARALHGQVPQIERNRREHLLRRTQERIRREVREESVIEEQGRRLGVCEGKGEEFGMRVRDEAFYEAEVQRVVCGCRHFVAVTRFVEPVGAVDAAGALDEADARVDCGDDVAEFERGKGTGLELAERGWGRATGRLHF